MSIQGLNHVSIVVADLEKTGWFYGTVLGMAPVERPPNFTFQGAWWRAGGTDIHAILAAETTAPAGMPDPGPAKAVGLVTHFAFVVDDVYAMRERLASFDWPIITGPIPRGDGAYQLFVEDPDGYMLELFQVIDSGEGAPPRGGFPA